MPIQGTKATDVKGFLGANIRIDSVDLSGQGGVIEMSRVVNADKHTTPQTIRLRSGREEQFSTPISGNLTVRYLAKVNGIRYQVSDSSVSSRVYRAQTVLQDYRQIGLDLTRAHTTIVGYKPLNDTTIWALIADRALMQKDDGTNTRRWGIAPPTTFTLAQLNSGTYTYIIGVSQIRFDGTALAAESNTLEATITE